MHREGIIYDEITKVIIEIYIDYDIKEFPIDEKVVCKKLGVALVPYSAFEKNEKKIFLKKSENGFFVKASKGRPPTIYYNDEISSVGKIRFTIFHEIKHYVFDDEDDSEDDLADFFARFFMCPIPYLILKDITVPEKIISFCNVSNFVAHNVESNIKNRKKIYGNTIFDYEVKLIEQIEPILVEVNNLRS
ncbi:protein of unknown function [Eubacterium uniforme]|uniref:Uncharacterized protein n=1 Tax=Eubacterium uniforme TaxID=39495 RepID=A0A1T4VW29_9FIRM|nr:ImmA/IrrE family metallo-endopeptidase [Eubacterium uniforme]SKA69166.1 protein of unknown function [Eubacterium uniforme]